MKNEFEGYFNLVIRDPITMEVKRETGFFKNLITDYGLNRLATAGVLNGACVGSGNAPPANSDVALQSQIARTSTTFSDDLITGPDSAPYYTGRRKTYRFAEGAAAGNLAEVGVISLYSGAYPLWSRSLIVDSSGNPITLTVLPNEVLDVVYEARIYAMESDSTGGPITLLGVNYTWTMRALNVRFNASGIFDNGFPGGAPWTGTNGDLASVTATASSGTSAGNSGGATAAAYVNNSFKRSFSFTYSISQGNNAAGGIKTMYGAVGSGSYPYFQIGLDKIFPKNNSNTLSFTFEVSWGRRTI